MRPRLRLGGAWIFFLCAAGTLPAQEDPSLESIASGRHDMRDRLSPDSYLEIPMKREQGTRVLTFDFELAREMRLQGIPETNDLTPELHQRILDAFAVRTIPPGKSVPAELHFPSTMIATKYDDGSGGRGDGRVVWAGMAVKKRPDGSVERIYDVTLKGAGVTPLRWSDSGTHSDGLIGRSEGLQEDLTSRLLHKLGIPTTRILAVIELDEVRTQEHTNGQRAVMLVRVGDQFRLGHLVRARREGPAAFRKMLDYFNDRLAIDQGRSPASTPAEFLERVTEGWGREAARWQDARVVHGAMSYANNSLGGTALDFGTLAAIDRPHPDYTTRFDDARLDRQPDNFREHARLLQNMLETTLQDSEGRAARAVPVDDLFQKAYGDESTLRTLRRLGFSEAEASEIRTQSPDASRRLAEVVQALDRVTTSEPRPVEQVNSRIESSSSFAYKQPQRIHAAAYDTHAALAALPRIVVNEQMSQVEKLGTVESLLDLKFLLESSEAMRRSHHAAELLSLATELIESRLPPESSARWEALRSLSENAKRTGMAPEALYRQNRYSAGGNMDWTLQMFTGRNVQPEMESYSDLGRRDPRWRHPDRPVRGTTIHPFAGAATYAGAFLLSESITAATRGDGIPLRDAARHVTSADFLFSTAAFGTAAQLAEMGISRIPGASRFLAPLIPAASLIAGTAATHAVHGRFPKGEIAVTSAAFLLAGGFVELLLVDFRGGWLLKLAKLTATIQLSKPVESFLRSLASRRSPGTDLPARFSVAEQIRRVTRR